MSSAERILSPPGQLGLHNLRYNTGSGLVAVMKCLHLEALSKGLQVDELLLWSVSPPLEGAYYSYLNLNPEWQAMHTWMQSYSVSFSRSAQEKHIFRLCARIVEAWGKMEKMNFASIFSLSEQGLLFCMQERESARKGAAGQKCLLLYWEHLGWLQGAVPLYVSLTTPFLYISK